MPEPDSTRQTQHQDSNTALPEAEDRNRNQREYDEFRETLATPLPNRAYRDHIETPTATPTPLELTIRVVAVLLSAVIAVRLLFGLFGASHARPIVGLVYNLTDWVVQPFQVVFGLPNTSPGGYFDWPAIAAIIVVGIIAGLFVALIRPRTGDE